MYRHTQVGYVTLAVSACVAAFVGYMASVDPGPALWLGIALPLVVAVLFGALTTEVGRGRFRFWFGPGLIRRSFDLSDIQSCAPVLNAWYYGWGIRWTPHGWLYNVSGVQAVELELRSGKHLRIGTDESTKLCEMIRIMKERPT